MAFLRSSIQCNNLLRKFGIIPNSLQSLSTPCASHIHGINTDSSKSQHVASPAQAHVQKDPLDISFNDHVAAFKSKKTSELVRAYIVYALCTSEYLVENNMKVSAIISLKISWKMLALTRSSGLSIAVYCNREAHGFESIRSNVQDLCDNAFMRLCNALWTI